MTTYLLGDHHCPDHDVLVKALAKRGLRHCRVIHLGDGEEGYPESWKPETPERLDADLAKLGIQYFSIRGNHSNPHVFDGSIDLPNFKLLTDYTHLEIDRENWLFVGGAISIDRLDRKPGITWWPEEEMVLKEELAGKADVLVTHTGPSWTTPPPNNLLDLYIQAEIAIGTKTLRRELLDEQVRHEQLFELVQPKQWYHGHHHHSATRQVGNCTIRQLGIAELVMHKPHEPVGK
jgi:hypothetical protein